MNSIVDNYVSYTYSYYSEGGAHPTYGSIFCTINAATEDTVNLLDIFNENDLIEALKNDEFIKESVSNVEEIESLEDFQRNTINTCAYNLSKDILISSFSFHHTRDSLVAIRIGIPYGCQADRGKFTQIGIYLPIPAHM